MYGATYVVWILVFSVLRSFKFLYSAIFRELSYARGATQDGQVMVDRFDRMWSTGEGNGKPLQYSCLENPMNSMKRQNNRILKEKLRKCTGHNKHPLPTTQEKTLYMDITRWSTPKSDWLYSLQMEKLYTISKNKTRSWLWLRPWTPYCQIQT